MEEQQPQSRRIPVAVIAGLSAAVLAAGGGTALWAWKSAQSPTPTPTLATSPTPAISPLPQSSQSVLTPAVQPPSVQPTAQKIVQIYWIKDSGQHLDLVPSSITLKDTNKPNAVLDDAFKRLLAGPTDPKLATTIPEGTKLRGVKVREDGVHVDLSKEFTSGGGSASMTARLAQVLYTASSLNPDAKVWLEVDGEKLEVLGGEGLLLDQPMTRKNFQKDFQL